MSYKREYKLEFNALDGTNVTLQQTSSLTGLMIDFNIKKTNTKTSNSAVIGITNASIETIGSLQKEGVISLSVGYEGEIARVLYGQKEDMKYTEQSTDRRIELSVIEGTASAEQLLFSKVYGVGVTTVSIVKDIVRHLIDNVPSVLSANPYTISSFKNYTSTQVVYGDAFKLLGDLLFTIGYEYFLNNGVLTILPTNGFLRDLEVDVSPQNGLIGSARPIFESKVNKTSKNGVEFKSLLNYNFDVGRRIRLTSRDFDKALFRIEEVTFIGNSFQGEWVSNVRAYEYQEQ